MNFSLFSCTVELHIFSYSILCLASKSHIPGLYIFSFSTSDVDCNLYWKSLFYTLKIHTLQLLNFLMSTVPCAENVIRPLHALLNLEQHKQEKLQPQSMCALKLHPTTFGIWKEKPNAIYTLLKQPKNIILPSNHITTQRSLAAVRLLKAKHRTSLSFQLRFLSCLGLLDQRRLFSRGQQSGSQDLNGTSKLCGGNCYKTLSTPEKTHRTLMGWRITYNKCRTQYLTPVRCQKDMPLQRSTDFSIYSNPAKTKLHWLSVAYIT